ncbi:helix-turn-helix transcriptional regulator [Gracilibacillus sp. JCM 18860]|uniref:LuxR C-terminal-related transcriptional regulator n=1 Tax=Gracilibacillus sp. JCM 18860 TaxID=1306159 RepID=UPI0006D1F289
MQPLMKVVLVASDKDDDAIEAFPSTNLDGYLVADMGLGDFQSIIRLVMDGMFVAPQTMIQQYVNKLHYIATHEDRDQLKHLLMLEDVELNIDIEEIVLQKSIFTDREFQIFRLLRKGWSNKMIANEINLKEGTVKNYVSIIYKKLEIKNRDELMQLESANV